MVAMKAKQTTAPAKSWGDAPTEQPKEETLWGNAGVSTEGGDTHGLTSAIDGANSSGIGPDTGDGPNPEYREPAQQPSTEDVAGADAPKATKKRSGSKTQADGKALEPDHGGNFSNAAKALVRFVERMERNAEEQKALKDDAKEIVAEAKALGYSTTIIRKVLARRKKGYDAIREEDSLIAIYEEALG